MRHIHLYPSPFTYESRILRETASIAGTWRADAISLVGIAGHGLPEDEPIDDRRAIWRVPVSAHRRVPVMKGLTLYAEWYVRILRRFRRETIGVVHCHSLQALPVGAMLKRAHQGAKLIYDAMELETERDWLVGLDKLMWKAIERVFIRHADAVAVVSPSIAAWYRRTYPRLGRIEVIRNAPLRGGHAVQKSSRLKRALGLAADEMLFIYQGGLTRVRGVELLLEVFRSVPTRHIVFLGYGPLEGIVREHAARYANIHFHPAVSPGELGVYTAGADIGIHLLPNSCLNAYYCLPNKVFEYLHAGLPIVVPDYPDLAALVDRFGCGWKLSGGIEETIRFVSTLSRQDVDAKSEGAKAARECLGWEEEEPTLLAIYDDLLARNRRPVRSA